MSYKLDIFKKSLLENTTDNFKLLKNTEKQLINLTQVPTKYSFNKISNRKFIYVVATPKKKTTNLLKDFLKGTIIEFTNTRNSRSRNNFKRKRKK